MVELLDLLLVADWDSWMVAKMVQKTVEKKVEATVAMKE